VKRKKLVITTSLITNPKAKRESANPPTNIRWRVTGEVCRVCAPRLLIRLERLTVTEGSDISMRNYSGAIASYFVSSVVAPTGRQGVRMPLPTLCALHIRQLGSISKQTGLGSCHASPRTPKWERCCRLGNSEDATCTSIGGSGTTARGTPVLPSEENASGITVRRVDQCLSTSKECAVGPTAPMNEGETEGHARLSSRSAGGCHESPPHFGYRCRDVFPGQDS
jgi:hypothetical protein